MPVCDNYTALGRRARNLGEIKVLRKTGVENPWVRPAASCSALNVKGCERSSQRTRKGGEGHFTQVVLRPKVTISATSDAALAEKLHHDAHAKCFVARSVNFPVTHEPTIVHAA